jgi:hypothetical protein
MTAMKQTREKYQKLTPTDRLYYGGLNNREAARFLIDVYNARCSAEWLASLPPSESPPFRNMKRGARRYIRGDLQKWAEQRPLDQWLLSKN